MAINHIAENKHRSVIIVYTDSSLYLPVIIHQSKVMLVIISLLPLFSLGALIGSIDHKSYDSNDDVDGEVEDYPLDYDQKVSTRTITESDERAETQDIALNEVVTGDNEDDNIDMHSTETWTNENVSISSGAGNDTVYSGDGNDSIFGGAGNDLLIDDYGDDLVFAGTGDDKVFNLSGSDTIFGGSGNDTILAGINSFGNVILDEDQVFGNQGDDLIYGGGGSDTLYGGDGNDTIDGQSDVDWDLQAGVRLCGDKLYGGNGDDELRMALFEQPQDTREEGWNYAGNDTLTGGAGSDSFLISTPFLLSSNTYPVGVITDFVSGEDILVLEYTGDYEEIDYLHVEVYTPDGLDRSSIFLNGMLLVNVLGANSISVSDIVVVDRAIEVG